MHGRTVGDNPQLEVRHTELFHVLVLLNIGTSVVVSTLSMFVRAGVERAFLSDFGGAWMPHHRPRN